MTFSDSEPVGRLGATSIDCADPAELADFYCRLLGMRRLIESPDGGVIAITDGANTLAMMWVDDYVEPAWPDTGQRQQMHLDVRSATSTMQRHAPSRWALVKPTTNRSRRCGGSCWIRRAIRFV